MQGPTPPYVCDFLSSFFHRKGSGRGGGSGAGEHPSRMGAHPQGAGRAPIRWGRAPLEKGSSTGGRGAPQPDGGAPLWKRGSSKSVTMNFNLLIQHTVSRWCSSGCVHEGCGCVDRWLQTVHWSSWVCFYSRPIRQTSTKCPLSPLQQLNF